LSIGPNTLVGFEKEMNEEGEELMIMTLEQGSFRSKILNLGSRQFFEVHTEDGKLRVHGTDFVTSFDGESDAGMNVAVLHGSVAIGPPESQGSFDDGVEEDSSVDEPAPVMLTQNQSGGMKAEGGSTTVNEMSYSDADALKNVLPIPGDGDQGLVMTDLGIDNVEVESFVQEVKAVQSESVVTPESITDDVQIVQQQIIRDAIQNVELQIRGGIDPGI
jgi:hypothetical protein